MTHTTPTTKSLEDVHSTVNTIGKKGFLRPLLAFIGPAYLVSVGYMDPGNWATDIAAGSGFGYSLIWVLLMSNIIAILLQSHCARLGVVRGLDLAQASKAAFPAIVNIPLYVLAEIAIAATDLAEVLGLAIGLNLLFGIPLLMGVSIAVLDALLLLVIINFGIRKMEAFIFSLVFIISASFFVEIFIAQPDPSEVIRGFIPSIPNDVALYIAIGIIGATVMPHNLYLHSALVQTRNIEPSYEGKKKALLFNTIDSAVALNIAFLVNASILILAGSVFFKNGYFEITEIQDAHELLAPLLGTQLAPILFAIALIASGQCSTITGTLAGQIVMEGYIHLRITPWIRRMLTRIIAVTPAFLVIWLKGEEETGELLILSQVILSLQLGFAVVPLIHFVSDKEKMGKFAIGIKTKIASWLAAAIIISLNVKLVLNEIISLLQSDGPYMWAVYFILIPIVLAAGILMIYIIFHPFISSKSKKLRVPHPEFLSLQVGENAQFSRIAITVDFSDKDQKTISRALTTGGKTSSYLLIHVVESAGAMFMERDISDLESGTDADNLRQYTEVLTREGYQVTFELGFGRRSKVIPKLVKKFNADLLVMGTHGHRGLKDLLFGETINAVRHKIGIPLLAVK